MMRKFIIYFTQTILMLIFMQHHPVASLSPNMEKIALFQFKQSLAIGTPAYCSYFSFPNYYDVPSRPKMMNWSMSSDYCKWEGVSCEHKTGNVIELDLSCSQLEGAILKNSTLFQLSHLRYLNLFGNNFSLSNQFPQEFGFFAKDLTHLNLSSTRFSGRVPSEISHLYKLVELDLSHNNNAKLEEEVFKSILQNLTQLRVLNLHGVDIPSNFPVNLSTSLRVLHLEKTGLHGVLPQEVFHLPNLEVLVLSYGNNLTVTLPKVKWGSSASLQHLYLDGINFSDGGIPDSIGLLESLANLILLDCNLYGPIPRSIGNLSQLSSLGFDNNNLHGPIPTALANLTNLGYLSFYANNFTGPLPSMFDHPSLEILDLSYNKFTGQLYEFDSLKSQLQFFSCPNNLLNGSIPRSFSQLLNLTELDLSSNNFSGVLDFKIFSRLEHLENLDLSHNSLSVRNASMVTLPPNLQNLGLSSCNMKEFPHFSIDAEIRFLSSVDLSNNDIAGEIPIWMGSVYQYLNLSHNRLSSGLKELPWNDISYLDVQSNSLNGSLPSLICNSSSLELLNLSHNKLSGELPDCSQNLTSIKVFDLRMNKIQGNIPAALSNFRHLETLNLKGNKLVGSIPSSFAEFNSLKVLDLGSNQINDTFPQCLEALPNLQVLVLKSNKFHGVINNTLKIVHPFPSLRILDLSYNAFSGPLPVMYLKNFKAMMNGEVKKIKRAYMGDNFYYRDSTSLVIKGVETELVRILTIFTAIDVSRNSFEGKIPEYMGNLVSLRYLNLSYNNLTGHIPLEIGKLLMMESLDLSFNRLQGEIPPQLTNIFSLARINLSCNQLTGRIPEGSQFNTFETDSYVGNLGLCGHPLSKKCEHYTEMQEESENDDDYFFSGFTWKAVAIGYGCGVVPAFIFGYLMLVAGKPIWFIGIIGRESCLKIRRMEIKWR